jgi:hypothetical protein
MSGKAALLCGLDFIWNSEQTLYGRTLSHCRSNYICTRILPACFQPPSAVENKPVSHLTVVVI